MTDFTLFGKFSLMVNCFMLHASVFVWVCAFSSYMLVQLLLFLELVATISTLVAVPSAGWHLLIFCLFMAHLLTCWLLDDSDLNDDNRMDLGFYHEIFVFCFGAVQGVTKRVVFLIPKGVKIHLRHNAIILMRLLEILNLDCFSW